MQEPGPPSGYHERRRGLILKIQALAAAHNQPGTISRADSSSRGGAVALSDREQKLLEQMEQALYAEDPRFAARIRTHSAGRNRRRMVIGVVGVLVGLGLVVLGVLDQLIWLGAVGFAVMVAAGVFAFAPARKSGPTGVAGAPARTATKKSKGSASFMQRIEQRWERRDRDQW